MIIGSAAIDSSSVEFSNLRTSTPNKEAIDRNVYKSGCEVFVHHLETVVGFTFSCSASHLAFTFFSQRTTFMRLIFSAIRDFFNLNAKIMIFIKPTKTICGQT